MILGSILLASAFTVVVALVGRLAAGRPGKVEQGAFVTVAIGLLVAGTGLFAANLLASNEKPTPAPPPADEREPADRATNTVPDTTDVQALAALPLEQRERMQLASLHHNTVEVFIDRPGFGMRRMMLPLEDIVNAPKKSTSTGGKEAVVRSSYPSLWMEDRAKKGEDVHFAIADAANGGKVNNFMSIDRGGAWKLKKVQLVGLAKNPDPVIYETNKVPGMKNVKDIPTRQPDAFEAAALKAIRDGEGLVIERKGDSARMMGPIFAGASCTKCHDHAGDLLGAFSYTLEHAVEKK
jgi:hypothetical protein